MNDRKKQLDRIENLNESLLSSDLVDTDEGILLKGKLIRLKPLCNDDSVDNSFLNEKIESIESEIYGALNNVKSSKYSKRSEAELKKTLLICSNSKTLTSVEFEQALDTIQKARLYSLKRDSFEDIKIEPRVKFNDMPGILREKQPDILHYHLHGSKRRGLLFRDAAGNVNPISVKRFRDLIRIHSNHSKIESVILCACHSIQYAEAIAPFVENVVGANNFITIPSANLYMERMYELLYKGMPFDSAHENAVLIVDDEVISERESNIASDSRVYSEGGSLNLFSDIVRLVKIKKNE